MARPSLGIVGRLARKATSAHSRTPGDTGTLSARLFEREIWAAARTAPLANLAHAGAVVLVGVFVMPPSLGAGRALWVLLGIGLNAYTLVAWVPPARGPNLEEPLRIFRQMLVVTVLFGLLWAVASAVCYPRVPDARAAVLTVALAGVGSCGAMALSTNRVLGITWVVSISTGVATVQVRALDRTAHLQAFEVLLYVIALSLGVIYLSDSFRARCLAEYAAEDERQKVELLLNEFETGSRDWIWETRADGTLSHVSTRFAEAADLTAEQLTGSTLPQLVQHLAVTGRTEGHWAYEELTSNLARETPFYDLEIPLIVNGDKRWWSLSGKLRSGSGTGWRGIGADITASKEARDHIDRIAKTDALTGLPNRYSFNLALEESLTRGGGESALHLAILDLDNFKSVNDTLGHPTGDQLLVAIAETLQRELFRTELCARLGGDEFALILSPGLSDETAGQRLEYLQSVLTTKTFSVQGNLLETTCSIGYISSRQVTPEKAEDLIVGADLALYAAKDSGRNRVSRYSDELRRRAEKRAQALHALATGLAHHEFELFYEPQVGLRTDELIGFEALVRWRHPKEGIVPPIDFIQVAEETGLIVSLGREVLRLACEDAATWPAGLRLSINVSPRQLLSSGFTDLIAGELTRTGLDARRLVIEITESVLLDPQTFSTLSAIRDMGATISVDDFGTGYSSLAQLHRTPVGELKIDGSFVRQMTGLDSVSTVIVDTIIKLARALGLRTVAEGVEDAEQREQLQELGCDLFQGYLTSKPMPANAVLDYIDRFGPRTTPRQ